MTLFLGLEWFFCLYVLCAVDIDLETSLESGLKYLIVGSFGSAILLFGSALVFGATEELSFAQIGSGRRRPADDPMLVVGPRDGAHRTRLQGLGRAVPHVDAGRVPGLADAA